MRRMRMRSSVPGYPGSSAAPSAVARSVVAREGSGSEETGVGNSIRSSKNQSESRKEAGDRWRMLCYQVRLSQRENQTRYSPKTERASYCTQQNFEMGGLNPLKWKMRTFAYVSVAILAFFILFVYKQNHHVTFDGIIKDTNPELVWEFVADFSNMKKLNPTLEDFNIVAESGNYEHWKYSAHYTEHLSHAPMIKNHAQSHFAVKPDVNSVSEFKFFSEGQNTKCVETIQYECPLMFSTLCRREVMYQREQIMKNLKSHFATINIRANENE